MQPLVLSSLIKLLGPLYLNPGFPRMDQLKYAEGANGIAVSGHDEATRTALDILSKGGTVADAAVAGAAVLSVALPHACGLGGDAFILIHDAQSNTTRGINASGPSAAAVSQERFPEGLPERGALTCNVPGMVGGWQALHDSFGSMPWADVLKPATRLAKEGIKASPVLARATALYSALLASDRGSKQFFLSNGMPLREGYILKQAQLAKTLEEIARNGSASLYQGAIGCSIAHACQAAGGVLSGDDFAAYAPEWVTPIATTYKGHEVRAMPPNSYGLYLLLQLMALEAQVDGHRQGLDAPTRFAKLIRAARAAFVVGARAVADPDPKYGAESVDMLLGPEGLKRLQAATGGKPANRGGTAVITVADSSGNAVTIIQSVFMVFGSGVSDPETGVLLNNRMLGFTLEDDHPNALAPRKRPAHTLCPAMVFKDNRLRYALSTPGGPGQTLTLVQIIQALIEEGASLKAAVEAPRWSMDLSGAALAEDTMPPSVVEGVKSLGVDMATAEPKSPFFGSVKAVEMQAGGRLRGVADHRRDATVRALAS